MSYVAQMSGRISLQQNIAVRKTDAISIFRRGCHKENGRLAGGGSKMHTYKTMILMRPAQAIHLWHAVLVQSPIRQIILLRIIDIHKPHEARKGGRPRFIQVPRRGALKSLIRLKENLFVAGWI